jgi:hypothetical protein
VHGNATPVTQVWLPPGSRGRLVTIQGARYDEQLHRAASAELVGYKGAKTATVRMAIPVSGHSGDPVEYAKEDKAVVWVAYADAKAGMKLNEIDVPRGARSTPTRSDANRTVLATDIKCAPGEVVRIVDIEIELKPGKAAFLMFDGNGPLPGAGIGGFGPGRLVKIFYGT